MNYKDLTVEQLAEGQEIYSKKDYLTVNEASIGLCVSPHVIRRKLKAKQIVGIKLFGGTVGRIDVKKTKRLFEQQTAELLKESEEIC